MTVVGARPQFVKAGPLTRALRRHVTDVFVHTGQHYDADMSDVFFAELDLPVPDRHLGVGSGPHGAMTGRMMEALEAAMVEDRPEMVVVLGDTNSTLAAALAAVKLGIPVAHVEAGLRSFDLHMPEEINRRLTDHVSTLLFCPTPAGVANLRHEGIRSGVTRVGDVMMDAVLENEARARLRPGMGFPAGSYYLATVHRQENVDDAYRLDQILTALERLPLPTLLPMHPRTRRRVADAGRRPSDRLRILPPASYLDMLRLTMDARAVLTDSGGLQKEAFILGTPCVTLRETTEWVETVRAGANVLAGADPRRILAAVRQLGARPRRRSRPRVYGKGGASETIARAIRRYLRP